MHQPPSRRSDLLVSPGFCLALIVLLLNDGVLKPHLANWWTGKASDVSGLAAFVIFCTAFLPAARKPIFSLSALAFLLWKSPLTNPPLTWWNTHTSFHLARVIDITDDIALCILPIAWYYTTRVLQQAPRRIPIGIRSTIALISMFAFAATSHINYVKDGTKYLVPGSPDHVMRRLIELGFDVEPTALGTYSDTADIDLQGRVTLAVAPVPSGGSVVTLVKFEVTDDDSLHQAWMREAVLYEVINPLRGGKPIDGERIIAAAERIRHRCVTLTFGRWIPVTPAVLIASRYQNPVSFALSRSSYFMYQDSLMPNRTALWYNVIRAVPRVPHSPTDSPSTTRTIPTPLGQPDFIDAWAAPKPDSLMLFGADVLEYGYVGATIEVYGRWTGDTLHGAAAWHYHRRPISKPAHAPVTAVRYDCAHP